MTEQCAYIYAFFASKTGKFLFRGLRVSPIDSPFEAICGEREVLSQERCTVQWQWLVQTSRVSCVRLQIRDTFYLRRTSFFQKHRRGCPSFMVPPPLPNQLFLRRSSCPFLLRTGEGLPSVAPDGKNIRGTAR